MTCDNCEALRRELAAAEARERELCDALESLQHGDGCWCEAAFAGLDGSHPRHSPECRKACELLKRKSNTAALDSLLEQARAEERERWATTCAVTWVCRVHYLDGSTGPTEEELQQILENVGKDIAAAIRAGEKE